MTELMLDTPLEEDQRQGLKTVKSAADSLLGIINDLLDFSKIEAGKLELVPTDFSLREAVGDTLRALAMPVGSPENASCGKQEWGPVCGIPISSRSTTCPVFPISLECARHSRLRQ